MPATGFSQSWTSGEIFDEADDRADLEPISKGCRLARNLMVTTVGPLKKRRGFFRLGPVADESKLARLIPFRRAIDDALMLEFGDGVAHVWQANGAPLMNAGVQVSFATPYSAAQLAGLRWRQIKDVIYFRHATGLPPQALDRRSNTDWVFAVETFTNGPWLPENITDSATLTFTGIQVTDANPYATAPHAAVIMAGQTVTIAAGAPVFTAAMVGDTFRIRAQVGGASIRSWQAGAYIPIGWFILSVGNIYISTYTGGDVAKLAATTPPVNTMGLQSDGCSTFQFLHDGAGIVRIDTVTDAQTASGTIVSTIPVGSGVATSYWARAAYGNAEGWPRAWPSVVEERLVEGATTGNLDFIDLTRTAGFAPTTEDFHPGLGTGLVIDTDAIRRRNGEDGGEIIWTMQATFLIVGTTDGEFVISGGLFGEPITPSSVIDREITHFGSYDHQPAKLEKGIAYITTGGQTLRTLRLDLQQNDGGGDMSFLSGHLADRGFAQLAWVKAPDRTLWVRLQDGGLCALVIHEEQQVRGFTTQQLGGGLACEDIAVLPGPGGFDTLWTIASRVKAGATQRWMMMQSAVADGVLGMDGVEQYAGAAVTTIGGLAHLAGETARVTAAGVWRGDLPVDDTGTLTLPAAVTAANIGLASQVLFTSLKLDIQTLGGTLMERQRVSQCTVDFLCTVAAVAFGAGRPEKVGSRLYSDPPGDVVNRRYQQQVTLAGDTTRDPRITITEDTPYDFGIYALRPVVVAKGANG